MKNFKCGFFLLGILLLQIRSFVNATVIGSNTAVSLISTMTTLYNGDIVTGFTALQGGFFINDVSVTATWNALFPVSGSVLLNGGALYLQRPLSLTDDAVLSLPGTIVGNGYSMDIAPTITNFSDGCVPVIKTIAATTIVPVGVSASTQSVGWSYDDRFVTIVGSPVSGTNYLANYFFDGTNLAFASGNTNDLRYFAEWHPSAYYLAAGGNAGLLTFSVNSSTGVLTGLSSVTGTACRAAGWHPTGAYIVASFDFGDTFMYPVNAGVLGAAITPSPAATNILSVDWTANGSYVALGGVQSFTVYQLNTSGSPALIQRATVTLVGGSPGISTVAWNPIYQNILAIGQANIPTGDLVRLYRFNTSTNTLTQVTSISGLSGFISSVDWSSDGECLMVAVANTSSTTNELRVYSFNGTDTTLRLVSNNSLPTVSPGIPSSYSSINNYIAQFCSTAASTNQLRISVPTNVANFSDLTMIMNNDLNLPYYYLTLSGDCSILGNGNTLSLQRTSTLAIAANSTLTLCNINLTGLALSSIVMQDNSSKLVLDNVTIALDGNSSFTQGTLEIEGDVAFIGQGSFIYSSTMPCAIDAQSTLFFDDNITFSFIPSTNVRNVLQFVDGTSHLFLNGATLVTTRTGIDFTKGALIVDRHARIASDATVVGEGIAFGDGINVANNMNMQLYPAAVLEVTKGIIVDRNV